MGGFGYANSIEGDVYIQRLASYIKKNEEALANGLLCFSKNKTTVNKIKPIRLTFTIHHLYYLTERIDQSTLGVDVGPLNVKLDNPNHEPTFVSFMANNARSSRHFDSDARSITSMNSMKSIVSSASVYWRSFSLSNDPKVIKKDIKYLYSSFTKIPCLILTPKTKINSISSYEEYPCDTSVPIKMFKNLQVLEMSEYEPNEIFGWNFLSDQLRILIIRKSKITDMAELLFHLVIEDANGRSSFNATKQKSIQLDPPFELKSSIDEPNTTFKYKRDRGYTNASNGAGSIGGAGHGHSENLHDHKWSVLKQLTISETSIAHIPRDTFKPLVNLVKLNLSNNLLEKLPEGLDQLVNVKYLNFADNFITSLKSLPPNLENLLTLNLNNNKLANLDGLENLISLEKIDLRRNKLSEVKVLKPLVQLVENNRLDNMYLSHNPLPKNYRVDLFNLFSGVKYKNTVKIDDSRPGYFEKAMMLDQEGATKNLAHFMDHHSFEHQHTRQNSAQLQESIISSKTIATTETTGTDTIATTGTLTPSSVVSKQDEIVNKIRNLHLDTSNKQRSPQQQAVGPAKVKRYDLSHTILSTSISLLSQPSSPLHTNSNLTNKLDSPNSMKMTHLNSSSSSVPSTPSMNRSNTLVDIENHNPAPSIVTPVQVTARMST
ncbi:hypothetical protein CANMA_000088 [Candida margitis]|uniref:uncharacterized protein n=1 Tax=Candida margitis TaxID=1775924 RepID=UPI00222656B1|nr:uncharacterized protein CANMA_000088 [Candida margitis]KAI5970928.1 hypothetical protein CANMA_000088 [Candida margitis]